MAERPQFSLLHRGFLPLPGGVRRRGCLPGSADARSLIGFAIFPVDVRIERLPVLLNWEILAVEPYINWRKVDWRDDLAPTPSHPALLLVLRDQLRRQTKNPVLLTN